MNEVVKTLAVLLSFWVPIGSGIVYMMNRISNIEKALAIVETEISIHKTDKILHYTELEDIKRGDCK